VKSSANKIRESKRDGGTRVATNIGKENTPRLKKGGRTPETSVVNVVKVIPHRVGA